MAEWMAFVFILVLLLVLGKENMALERRVDALEAAIKPTEEQP